MPAVTPEEAAKFRLMYNGRMSMKQIIEQIGRGLGDLLTDMVDVTAKIQEPRVGDRSMSISYGWGSADKVMHLIYKYSSVHMRSDRKFTIAKGAQ